MLPNRRREPSPSEAEAARHPDAVAGQALLEERLQRLTPGERTAFEDAVRRCFASAAEGSEDGSDDAADGAGQGPGPVGAPER
ncbi:hypothetical protein [Methylobacterium oxalidis]|uniref:Uncharacterized protein n=1 Tax=Methylobacterium oxalidis TaxID=944322 RepID=A0A512J337_9HYPH|nr:hypothetical protein [Methylobacterium oxalidis]GEP04269.1 hypothetical protein MOX02_23070 [Methylobacterium oxalidis]GJE33016.1 hypothetical protein LDDCCGHA_3215 [Methylobacterium oxalidis]GLS67212.1 hypothetical protein GCM10007888_55950 [Methylobacterium oxalidis]